MYVLGERTIESTNAWCRICPVVIQPQLSLDALRLRWGLKDDFAWLMQEDPDMYTRWDGQRDRVANTGFWILKNDPRTFAMLLDLIECPSRVGIASQLVT